MMRLFEVLIDRWNPHVYNPSPTVLPPKIPSYTERLNTIKYDLDAVPDFLCSAISMDLLNQPRVIGTTSEEVIDAAEVCSLKRDDKNNLYISPFNNNTVSIINGPDDILLNDEAAEKRYALQQVLDLQIKTFVSNQEEIHRCKEAIKQWDNETFLIDETEDRRDELKKLYRLLADALKESIENLLPLIVESRDQRTLAEMTNQKIELAEINEWLELQKRIEDSRKKLKAAQEFSSQLYMNLSVKLASCIELSNKMLLGAAKNYNQRYLTSLVMKYEEERKSIHQQVIENFQDQNNTPQHVRRRVYQGVITGSNQSLDSLPARVNATNHIRFLSRSPGSNPNLADYKPPTPR